VIGEAVLDARRHLGVHGTAHNTVALEGAELLCKHLRGDAVERALKVGEAAHVALEEQEDDVCRRPSGSGENRRVLATARVDG
jgi:hypothetical protein